MPLAEEAYADRAGAGLVRWAQLSSATCADCEQQHENEKGPKERLHIALQRNHVEI